MIVTLLLALLAWLLGPFAPLAAPGFWAFIAVASAEVDAVPDAVGLRAPTPSATAPLPFRAVIGATPTCFGRPATVADHRGRIDGTPGDDVIVGDDRGNFIDAGAGDDLVCGGGGKDSLEGGPGQDRLDGGPGNDWLHDLNGDDDLEGGPGRDRCELTAHSTSGCELLPIFD